MPLLDVQSGSDITSAIHAALDAGWTDVEIPAGTFTVAQAIIDEDGVTLRGQGATTTLVRGNFGRVLWVSSGVDGFTLKDLRLDLRSTVNYLVGVEVSGTLNPTVHDVHFFTDDLNLDDEPPTNMAIFARGAQGLRVYDCTGYQVQFKINGSSRDAVIRDCTFTDSRNFAISCVTREIDHFFEDVRIVRVTSLRGYAGGIFVGTDGDTMRGQHRRVTVQDCTVTMAHDHPVQTFGIIVRCGDLTEDVYIVGNTVSVDPQGVGTTPYGLLVKPINAGGTLRGLTVAGNSFDVDTENGIGAHVSLFDATGVRITDNTISDLRLQSWSDAEAHLGQNTISGTLRRDTAAGCELRVSYEGNTIGSEVDAHQGTYMEVPVPVPMEAGREQATVAIVSTGTGRADVAGTASEARVS